MTPAVEKFKRQFDGWMRYRDLYGNGTLESIWLPPTEDKEWVAARIWIEDTELFGVMNAYRDDFAELEGELTNLMESCGVWYEQENCCILWIYDPDVLDAFMDTQEAAKHAAS